MKKETELKYSIKNHKNLQDIEKLIKNMQIGHKKILHQENYFFDTLGYDLYKNKLLFRLRNENEKKILTLKSPFKINDNKFLTNKVEYEKKINKKYFKFIMINDKNIYSKIESLAEKNTLLSETKYYILNIMKKIIKQKELRFIGNFKNKRTSIPFKFKSDNFTLELDEFSIGKKVFYEVEVEVNEKLDHKPLETFLCDLFYKFKINFQHTTAKSDKFYKIMKIDN